MRLIDADKLIEKLDPEYKATVKLIKSGETHLDNLAEGYTEVHNLIAHAPTVDTKLVRCGHWGDECVCSVCSWMHEDYNGHLLITTYKYCPNCGAKMNEGNKMKYSYCLYDEAFTTNEMLEETNRCKSCTLNCFNASNI